MLENQKNENVAGNNSQQNKDGQPGENNREAINEPSGKPSHVEDDAVENIEPNKEIEQREQQHDYITPVGEQNSKEERQYGEGDVNQSSKQTTDNGKSQHVNNPKQQEH